MHILMSSQLLFNPIIIFYLMGKQIKVVSVSGEKKAGFMLKVIEKPHDVREDYIGALRIDSNVTHEETKNFITDTFF